MCGWPPEFSIQGGSGTQVEEKDIVNITYIVTVTTDVFTKEM